MQIDQMVALLHDLFGNLIRSAVGLRAVDLAGVPSIHALAIHRIEVWHFLLERLNVDERHDNHCAGNLSRVQHADQFLQGNDRSVFGAMGAGDEGEHRPGLRAMKDGDGNAQGSVAPRRHFDRAGSFLPTRCGGRANCKRGPFLGGS